MIKSTLSIIYSTFLNWFLKNISKKKKKNANTPFRSGQWRHHTGFDVAFMFCCQLRISSHCRQSPLQLCPDLFQKHNLLWMCENLILPVTFTHSNKRSSFFHWMYNIHINLDGKRKMKAVYYCLLGLLFHTVTFDFLFVTHVFYREKLRFEPQTILYLYVQWWRAKTL